MGPECAAAGAQGQGDGVAGTGIQLKPGRCFGRFFGRPIARRLAEFEHGPKGAGFDCVDDHPVKPQPACLQQGNHQVVAEGSGGGFVTESGQDVLGLGLVDPNWHLAPAGGIPQQHDRAAAGCIQSDSSNVHFDHFPPRTR